MLGPQVRRAGPRITDRPGRSDEGLERVLELELAEGWAAIAIASTRRGPAFGGIRRRRDPDRREGLAEVRGLARAMARKCALAELAAGGGKAVVWIDRGADPSAVYLALGELIERLAGVYVCGPDVGTGPVELATIRRATRHCNRPEHDAGRSTARGVLAAIDACAPLVWPEQPALAGRTAQVQGLGDVGGRVAAGLAARGAEVVGVDPDPAARARARAAGLRLAPSAAPAGLGCALFVPCALGGIVDAAWLAAGVARLICGSANEQLADPGVGQALVARGIALVPDVLASAGAVIEGVLGRNAASRGQAPAEAGAVIEAAIAAIGPRSAGLLAQARAERRCPRALALAQADAALGWA